MQPGSLIECIKQVAPFGSFTGIAPKTMLVIDYFKSPGWFAPVEIPLPMPVAPGLTLDAFDITYFRELLPPEEISIDELLEEPVCM